MTFKWKRQASILLCCLLLFSSLGLTEPAGYADASGTSIIIDNGDPGFYNSGFSTATSIKGYNDSSTYYTGHWEPYVTWTPSQANGFTAGEYTVSIYMVQRPSQNAAALLEVHTANGSVHTENIVIDDLPASGFVSLGSFSFSGSDEEYIRLSKLDGSSGFVHADAVKLDRVPSGLSENANLGSLSIGGDGALTPPFEPAVTLYTYTVPYDTESVTITAMVEDEHASLYVNGVLTEDGMASAPIGLTEGSNAVNVMVQAQEPNVLKTYSIQIYRLPAGSDGPAVLENEAYRVTEREDRRIEVLDKETGAAVDFEPQFTVVYDEANPRKGTGKITGAAWKSGNGDLNYTVLAWGGNSDFSEAPGTTAVHTAAQSVHAGNVISWHFPPGDGYTLSAQLQLDEGTAEPKVTYTLTPSVPRYYTAAFTGAPTASPAAAEWILQPLIWQGKRIPDRSYLTDESRGTLPLVMYGREGIGIGVIADVPEMPYRLPTLANSRFGMLLRDANGQLSPAIYAPVYGGEGSYMSSPFTFSVRLLVKAGDSDELYEHAARNIFHFQDYRENGLTTLNETLDNLVDYILNSTGANYSYWNEEYKAYEYVNDKPGYGRQQSAVYALALAMVRDNTQLYEERARPTIEYLASRQTQYMKLDGYDPSYPMGGPVRNYVGDWVQLYQMTGERTHAFKQLFDNGLDLKLPGSGSLLNRIDSDADYSREEALNHAKQWLYELISAYRLTGDEAYLADAVKVTDDYIYWRLEQQPTDFYDAQSSFYTDIAPMYYTLFEMYELTGNPDYLDAFLQSMRSMLQFIQLSPVVPSGDITLDGETVPAWRVSEIGLTSEAGGTSHSHRAIFMPYYSAYLALAAEYAEDGAFFRDLAKSSIVGRYSNFPGYTMRTNYSTAFEKPDYPLQWYSTYSNTAHMNHPLPMASMIVEYLVSDIFHRSERNISFPSRYTDTGAYFKNKVYGDRPGQFYGHSDVWLWLPKGLLETSSRQINYIAGYDDDHLYLALSNQSQEEVTVTLGLNPALVHYPEETSAQVWVQNAVDGYAAVSAGKVTVQVAADGITALAIPNVQAITELQGELHKQHDEKLHEYSYVAGCEPFGGMAGMVISLSPTVTSAYVYANSGQDLASSMTLHYAIDDGPWQQMIRDRFPFEFTVPLDEGVTEFKYYIVDSEDRASSTRSLWVSTLEEPEPRPEQSVKLNDCALPDPIDPGPPAEEDNPPVLFFTENFEGSVEGWTQARGQWEIVEEDGNRSIQLPSIGTGIEEGMLLAGDTSWTDYIVEARVKAHSNGPSGYASGITARAYDENNMYLFRLNWANNRAQLLKKQNGVWTSLRSSTAEIPLSLNEWYTMTFELQGNSFKGYVDGELMLEYTDDSLQYGGIGVRTYNQEAAFDDFKVWLHDAPRMIPAYSERFDSGDMGQWMAQAGVWDVVMEDASYVLKQSSTAEEAIAYTGDTGWSNYVYEADVKFLNDSTIIASGIAARYVDENNYYGLRMFSDTSAVQLFKKVDGQLVTLGEAQATVDAGRWYKLKLTVTEDRIDAYVDGVRRITATDDSLASGGIAVFAQNEQLLVDNIRVVAIYIPARLRVEPELRQVAVTTELQLFARLEGTEEDYEQVVWISDNPAIAVVDAHGKLEAIMPGTAVIRALPLTFDPTAPVHPAQITIIVYEPGAEQPPNNGGGGGWLPPVLDPEQPGASAPSDVVLTLGAQRLQVENFGDKRAIDLRIPAASIRAAVSADAQAGLVVRSELAAYELPLHGIDWERIAAVMGAAADELHIRIAIQEPDSEITVRMQEQADRIGASLLGAALDFQVWIASDDKSLEWHDFGLHYITRSLYLDAQTEVSNASGVRYDEALDQYVFVPTVFLNDDEGGTTAVMRSMGNSLYAVISHEKTFADIAGHWAQQSLQRMAGQLMISGMNERSFDPDGDMTRAQFASLLVRSLGMKTAAGSEGTFADVQSGDWYAGEVEAARDARLIEGFPDGAFRANGQVTRAQMAVMLDRALQLIHAADPSQAETMPLTSVDFSDAAAIPAWAEQAVSRIAGLGVMVGYPGGGFRPNAYISRAESAVAIDRLLRLVGFIDSRE